MARRQLPRGLRDEATTFLAPIITELARGRGQHGGRGLPRIGLVVRTQLLDAPPTVAPWLADFIRNAPTRAISRRHDIAQTVQLLGALHPCPPLSVLFELALRLAEDPEADRERGSPVFGALGQAFSDLGPAIVQPLVPFLAGNDRDVGLLLVLVAEAGVHDDRLLTMFIEALGRHPCDAATALLLLGDTRALTPLRRRLARLPAEGADDHWCRAAMSLTHAIEELGGVLDERDRCRADDALALHRLLYAAKAAAANAMDRALTGCGEGRREMERS